MTPPVFRLKDLSRPPAIPSLPLHTHVLAYCPLSPLTGNCLQLRPHSSRLAPQGSFLLDPRVGQMLLRLPLWHWTLSVISPCLLHQTVSPSRAGPGLPLSSAVLTKAVHSGGHCGLTDHIWPMG